MNHKDDTRQTGSFTPASTIRTAPSLAGPAPQTPSGPVSMLLPWLLVAINVGVWLVQLSEGVDWLDPDPDALIAWGGSVNVLTLTGDYWRLLTSMFLHGGALHLAVNMYMLLLIAPAMLRVFGRGGMAGVYLVGGLWASAAGAFWTSLSPLESSAFPGLEQAIFGTATIELIVSVGASGALMAMCGALLIGLMSSTANRPDDTQLRNGLFQVVGINLVIGFLVPGIDQAGHVGGLVAGVILGAAFGTREMEPACARRMTRILVVSLLALGGLAGLLHAGEPKGLRELREEWYHTENPLAAERQANRERVEDAAGEERAQLPPPVPSATAQGRVLALGTEATAMAMTKDERFAYVVSNKDNALLVLDLESGSVVRRIAGPAMPITADDSCPHNFCKGQGATAIGLLEERKLALVASMHRDSLAVVDLVAGKITQVIPLGRFPRAIALSPDGHRAYVQNAVDNTVSVVDLDTWKVVATLALEQSGEDLPFGRPLSLWTAYDRLFVVNAPDRTIEVFDTARLKPVHTEIPVEWFDRVAPYTAEYEMVWGLSRTALQALQPRPYQVRRLWQFCPHISAARFAAFHEHANAALVAVSDAGSGAIWIANVDTGLTYGVYPTPSPPVQLQFSADGKALYALASGGTLSIIDPAQRMDAGGRELLCTRPEDARREE